MNIATLLTGIATVAWLVFVGAVALVIVRATRSKPMRGVSSDLFTNQEPSL